MLRADPPLPAAALLFTGLLAALPGCNTSVGRALSTGCLAGCEEVPAAQTSEARPPVRDPGRPPAGLTMVWLHHSTGDRLLQGGLRAAIQGNNIAFHDINYGEARVDGYVIGDHTDPPDFPRTFNTPDNFEAVATWELAGVSKGRQHDIIMFKSCFPSSNITSEAMLAQYQRHYRALLHTFRAHPGTLFIPMSTPPLVHGDTTAAAAGRARRFARWLTTEYAAELKNVQAFDLFDALAVRTGYPHANTLVPQFATSTSDSHPSRRGGAAVARLFIPWLNAALRRASRGHQQP